MMESQGLLLGLRVDISTGAVVVPYLLPRPGGRHQPSLLACRHLVAEWWHPPAAPQVARLCWMSEYKYVLHAGTVTRIKALKFTK